MKTSEARRFRPTFDTRPRPQEPLQDDLAPFQGVALGILCGAALWALIALLWAGFGG